MQYAYLSLRSVLGPSAYVGLIMHRPREPLGEGSDIETSSIFSCILEGCRIYFRKSSHDLEQHISGFYVHNVHNVLCARK